LISVSQGVGGMFAASRTIIMSTSSRKKEQPRIDRTDTD
jgi:hypothetical protein